MRQQIAAGPALVPLGEVVRRAAIFAGTVMFQADTAQLLGQRQQEFVMVEVTRAVQLVHLLHQRSVRLDLLGLGLQRFGFIGEHIEIDRLLAGAQLHALVVLAGEHRRIDQVVEIDRLESHRVANTTIGFQCGGIAPTSRQRDAGLRLDVAREITGRVQRGSVPLQVEHLRGHHHPALVAGLRREEFELGGQLGSALRHVHLECIDIELVAFPWHDLAIDLDHQTGELVDRPGRRMIAGNPLRV